MSKLLKSKFLLGVMIVAVMAVVGFTSNVKSAAADCTITTTLRVGSTGTEVQCLQAVVGATADGKFGPMTKASVMAWQSGKGLVADGVFGPKSRAVFSALGGASSFAPAGCTSATGFSPSTGGACYAVASTSANTFAPAGCTSATGFSPSTGGACYAVASNTSLPTGCTSTAGFSSTTGASCATGVVVNATGPITVTLASDNPASGSFLEDASGVVFAKFTFTGTGTVTSVKLQRTGISASTTLSNIYLYDGATRLTDGASLGSDNTATFNAPNGLFTVAGSRTISVVADTLVADYSLALGIIGYTANGTASVVNVKGNEMYGATATLAAITMSAATGSGATDPGLDITVWQGTATVATRDVLLKTLALRQIGSIDSADIGNFKLYADGVLVTTVASLDANKYVTFATSYALKTGARTLKVTADIIGGSNRTVQFSLRGSYDILATDTQYNANGTSLGTYPFGPAVFTLNPGSLTVIKKTDSQATNVTLGASDQSLATYTFTAYGEPIKVETLQVGIIADNNPVATGVSLRNVRILVDGAQVGSNTTVPAATSYLTNTGTAFTTNFYVYPGKPATVEIRSDIYDNEDTDTIAAGTTTTIQALLVGGADINNGVPQVSITAIDVPTTANALGNVLTISSGSIALAQTTSYVSRTTAVPTTAYKIGSFQLSGNSTEAVNLNTIYVGWAAGNAIVPADVLSDLYVVYGGTTTAVKGTVTGAAAGALTNSNSWSINKTLAKNETIQIDVYATLSADVGVLAIQPTLAVAGTTASSGIAVYADDNSDTTLAAGESGQTITGATGSLTMSNDASTALAQIVDDSGTIKSLTAKIVALTDSYTVTDLVVTVTDVSAVSTVTLKYHDAYNGHAAGEVIGSKSAATSLTWSGLDLPIAASTTMKIDVELALTSVGVAAGTSDAALTTAISAGYLARNSAGTSAAGSGSASGNAIYVYKAIPLLSALALPNSTLAAGANKVIAKFSVSSNTTGTIAWKQVMFAISKTATPTLASYALYDADNGTQVNAGTVNFNVNNDTVSNNACDGADTACELLVSIGTDADEDAMEQVSTTKNYELRATVGGAIGATDNVSVSIDRNTVTHVAADDYMAKHNDGTASTETFVWSDESNAITGSTDAAITTWNSDYLVKNLPLSWSLD